MIKKKCIGCGIDLQHEEIGRDGYVPEEKFIMEDELLCQRCFKIKNYGKNIVSQANSETYAKEVSESVKKSDILLPIFDIIDFEGSFTEEILDLLRDYRSVVLINKIDLLPDFVHPSEIAEWIKRRLAEEDIAVDDIAFISAKSRYGINGIVRKISNIFPNKKIKAAVIGVSNVGKSSVINLLLKKDRITTSKYSGTTLKSINNKIPDLGISIIDTPGLIPDGRISDFLDAETGLKLVPSGEIARKTFKLKENQVFMFDVLCNIKILAPVNNKGEQQEYSPIFSVFSSKNVKFHVAKEERMEELLKGNYFQLLKGEEKERFLSRPFVTHTVEAEEGEEIAVAGLGWINIKRGPLKAEITVPEGVKVVIRPGLLRSRR